jgi:hypothetical protein
MGSCASNTDASIFIEDVRYINDTYNFIVNFFKSSAYKDAQLNINIRKKYDEKNAFIRSLLKDLTDEGYEIIFNCKDYVSYNLLVVYQIDNDL